MRILSILILLLPNSTFAESLFCPCTVVDVIDGDTVFVQDQFRSSRKIWLAGIDAPELGQPYGEQSKKQLQHRVLEKSIEVEYLKRDQYGRILGKLIKDGLDINLQQINNGYAWYFKQGNNELSRQDHAIYKSAENTAKTQNLGLWSYSGAIPPWVYRSNQ